MVVEWDCGKEVAGNPLVLKNAQLICFRTSFTWVHLEQWTVVHTRYGPVRTGSYSIIPPCTALFECILFIPSTYSVCTFTWSTYPVCTYWLHADFGGLQVEYQHLVPDSMRSSLAAQPVCLLAIQAQAQSFWSVKGAFRALIIGIYLEYTTNIPVIYNWSMWYINGIYNIYIYITDCIYVIYTILHSQ